jgi:hypothetical protein
MEEGAALYLEIFSCYDVVYANFILAATKVLTVLCKFIFMCTIFIGN